MTLAGRMPLDRASSVVIDSLGIDLRAIRRRRWVSMLKMSFVAISASLRGVT